MHLTAATLILVLPVLAATSSPASAQVADEHLVAMSRALFETQILDQDSTYLLENSADEYTVIAPGRVIEDRDQVIQGLGVFAVVDSMTISKERAFTVGNTGVVLNRLEIHGGPIGPMGQLGPVSAMTIFSRDGTGRWIALSRSLTRCDPRAVERGIC